jgi:hypothetical protein
VAGAGGDDTSAPVGRGAWWPAAAPAAAAGMNIPDRPMRNAEWVRLVLGLFFIVFATRIALALLVAPEIPFYDEWDGVIDGMARPLLAGNFSLHFLLEPHNEHPLLWTKALSYLMLRAGDLQFDNVPVCEVSQLIYAALAAVLIGLAAGNLPQARGWFVASAGAAAMLPYGWENIGAGWDNSFYFLLAFSAGAIILASRMRGKPAALILLGAMTLAAGVSMATGVFAGAAALLALGLRLRIGTLSRRSAAVAALLIVVAMAASAVLVARSDRVAIAWGLVQSAELAVLVLLMAPTWLLLFRLARGNGSNADVAFVAVSLWGCMQIGALLLGRPAFRLWFPISRYVEILAAAAFANLGCLSRLATAYPAQRAWALAARAAMAGTLLLTLAFAPFAWHWMNVRADNERIQAQRLASYIHDDNAHALDDAPAQELPYPSRQRLRQLVDAADVRLILGDRVGTRAVPSRFVQAVRTINAVLAGNGYWLLPLGVAIGLLLVAAALRSPSLPASRSTLPAPSR